MPIIWKLQHHPLRGHNPELWICLVPRESGGKGLPRGGVGELPKNSPPSKDSRELQKCIITVTKEVDNYINK